MKLSDLYESPNPEGIYEPSDDKRVQTVDDTRKPRLTLRHLNRLRKYKEFKQQELATKNDVVAIVYKPDDVE